MYNKNMDYQKWEKLINTFQATLTYFSAPSCGVCHVLKPQVIDLLRTTFPKIELIGIDASESKELCGQLSVFSVPTVIITFEGKEYKRFSRNFSTSQLKEEITRPYNFIFEK